MPQSDGSLQTKDSEEAAAVEVKEIQRMTVAPERETLRYVLITPARDEAQFIPKTLESMIHQTVLPVRWVIVSDGSTDGTDEIVQQYAANHSWIELVRTPERTERNFGGKVNAFNAGYERVKLLEYDVIGNLDGDASFEPDYIEYLLKQFEAYPKLGVAGTNYLESAWQKSLKHDFRFSNSQDVSGICQLFRRKCFEATGGYQVSRSGGVDLIASIRARMHGWETQTFSGRFAVHHRQQGTAEAHKYLVEFHNGRKDFIFGSHVVWELCRAAYRLTKKPYVVGGCFIVAGYFCALLKNTPKTVSPDVVVFRRKEQLRKLFNVVRGKRRSLEGGTQQ
jgi:biofilm PGA synthesis N-glycosyltransferase PgaC